MKQKKQYSMVSRVFFMLMMVILLQASLSLYTIQMSNIATRVESYSYNTFTRTVLNRKSNIESFMTTNWSNLIETSQSVSEKYQDVLGEKSELNEAEKVIFLDESTSVITQMMMMAGTTGGFIILNDGGELSNSTIYLKNYDSVSQVLNTETLMLARGPGEVSKKHDFSLVSNWSYGINLTEDNLPILTTPLKASETVKDLEYLPYWHISEDITNENLKVLTCSMPFFDENGVAMGVVGVEISQEYLYQFLPYNEFGSDVSHGYLMVEVDGSRLTPTMQNTTEVFPYDQWTEMEDLPINNQELDNIPRYVQLNQENLCVYYDVLDIYTNNSPYDDSKIWLMGVVDLDSLTSFTTDFWQSIGIMIVISLLGGVIISYFMGRAVARPILTLSNTVSSYDVHHKISFPQSDVVEIDELSDLIVGMQENILRSVGRTDKIFELLNMGVGSFEYVQGANKVTISGAVYKIMGFAENCDVDTKEFFKKLEELKSNPVEDLANTFQLEDKKYIKIQEFTQENLLLGVIQDNTKEVEDLLVLNYERNYDLLTGIYNRRAFHDRVTDLFHKGNFNVAGFIMFDLDNLKYVNDTFGHDSGDMYIKTAATMIANMLQKHGVVGRMSGDEFYAFIHGFPDKDTLLTSLHDLYAHFEAVPIAMPNGTEFRIRASGGLAWYGDDSTDLEELKKFADFAMYKGKHTLKGELRLFDREQYLQESFILSGKAELDRILDNEQVNFVFQPIIDAKTGELYAYEALMRPQSEILASPLKLLQLAALEGKLWKVEKITLFKTLSLFKKHRELFQGTKMFLNSIPTECLNAEEMEEFYEHYGTYLSDVVMEITEQEQTDENFILEKLAPFQGFGMEIALDDYGSGYANDIGLIRIKPNLVKIDRSLISNVHVDPSRQAIVHKIISFCQEHGITVLGEGVETEQELEYLIHAGIQLAQGYFISRPLDLPNFDNTTIKKTLAELQKPSS